MCLNTHGSRDMRLQTRVWIFVYLTTTQRIHTQELLLFLVGPGSPVELYLQDFVASLTSKRGVSWETSFHHSPHVRFSPLFSCKGTYFLCQEEV